jgi:transcriptional regulator with XRE-family HTH domain
MDISEKILELRKSPGYSQEKLAELLHVSRQAVSKWESGAALPTLDNLIELSKLFQAPLDALTGTSQEKAPDMAQERSGGQGREGNEGQTRPARADRDRARDRRQRNASLVLAGVLLSALVISILSNAARSAEMTSQIAMLSGRVSALESRSYSLPQAVEQPITGWQAQSSLVADFSYEVEQYDPKTGLLGLSVSATPKVYVEGMTALFSATAKGMDSIEMEGAAGAGKAFTRDIEITRGGGAALEYRVCAGWSELRSYGYDYRPGEVFRCRSIPCSTGAYSAWESPLRFREVETASYGSISRGQP